MTSGSVARYGTRVAMFPGSMHDMNVTPGSVARYDPRVATLLGSMHCPGSVARYGTRVATFPGRMNDMNVTPGSAARYGTRVAMFPGSMHVLNVAPGSVARYGTRVATFPGSRATFFGKIATRISTGGALASCIPAYRAPWLHSIQDGFLGSCVMMGPSVTRLFRMRCVAWFPRGRAPRLLQGRSITRMCHTHGSVFTMRVFCEISMSCSTSSRRLFRLASLRCGHLPMLSLLQSLLKLLVARPNATVASVSLRWKTFE